MNQKRYNELLDTGFVKIGLQTLAPFLSLKSKERQKNNKEFNDRLREIFNNRLKIGKMISKYCVDDPNLFEFFESKMDKNIIIKKVGLLEKICKTHLHGLRSSANSVVNSTLISTSKQFLIIGIKRKEIIEFIYKYLCDNSFDDYKGENSKSNSSYIKQIVAARKDRIRVEYVDPAIRALR